MKHTNPTAIADGLFAGGLAARLAVAAAVALIAAGLALWGLG